MKKEVLLHEVQCTLFAPSRFEEFQPIATNTEIVTKSRLKKLFENCYNEMLVCYFD